MFDTYIGEYWIDVRKDGRLIRSNGYIGEVIDGDQFRAMGLPDAKTAEEVVGLVNSLCEEEFLFDDDDLSMTNEMFNGMLRFGMGDLHRVYCRGIEGMDEYRCCYNFDTGAYDAATDLAEAPWAE